MKNHKSTLKIILICIALCFALALLYTSYNSYKRYIPTQLAALLGTKKAEIMPQPLDDQAIEQINRHQPIQEIQVHKSARVVRLMHQNAVVREYPMRLGFDPIGHKQQEGDGKTPEGRYSIDWRNSNSAFYKSLHISYPNADDRRVAATRGVSPGGEIMIHGATSTALSKQPGMMQYLPQNDWTLGCVSVRNVDMDEIWKLVKNNTPIEILP